VIKLNKHFKESESVTKGWIKGFWEL